MWFPGKRNSLIVYVSAWVITKGRENSERAYLMLITTAYFSMQHGGATQLNTHDQYSHVTVYREVGGGGE